MLSRQPITKGVPPWRGEDVAGASRRRPDDLTAAFLPSIPTPVCPPTSLDAEKSSGAGQSQLAAFGANADFAEFGRRAWQTPMPPLSKWLKRELSKVKIPLLVDAGESPGDQCQDDNLRQGVADNALEHSPSASDVSIPSWASCCLRDMPQIPAHVVDKIGPRYLLYLQKQYRLDKGLHDPPHAQLSRSGRLARERAQLRSAERRGISVGQRIAMRQQALPSTGEQEAPPNHASQKPGSRVEDVRVERSRERKVTFRGSQQKKAVEGTDMRPEESGSAPVAESGTTSPIPEGGVPRRGSGNRIFQMLPLRSEKKARIKNIENKRREKKLEAQERMTPGRLLSELDGERLAEIFVRYDTHGMGLLKNKEVRAAFNDLGVKPSVPEEKRVLVRLFSESACTSEAGLDFDSFVELLSTMRDELLDVRRTEVEDMFNRSLSYTGLYCFSHLQLAVQQIGNTGPLSHDEMALVQAVFDGYEDAVNAITSMQTTNSEGRSVARTGVNLLRRLSSSLEAGNTLTSNSLARQVVVMLANRSTTDRMQLRQFDLFEILCRRAVERVIAARREQERTIAEDLRLTGALLDECRHDLVELQGIFKRFDEDDSAYLDVDEVMNLLAAFGCEVKGKGPDGDSEHIVVSMIRKAKIIAFQMATTTKVALQPKGDNSDLACDFLECVILVKMMRNIQRERRQDKLKAVFNYHAVDKTSEVPIKELSRLLRDLNCSPRTRQDQQAIRHILDEVDQDGSGSLSFSEFEMLVQRLMEHMERVARFEEERVAAEIGLPLKRCRTLHRVFEENVKKSGGRVIHVPALRRIMDKHLEIQCTSEELLELFDAFSDETLGGIDAKGLLRLVHSVENPHQPPKPPPKHSLFDDL